MAAPLTKSLEKLHNDTGFFAYWGNESGDEAIYIGDDYHGSMLFGAITDGEVKCYDIDAEDVQKVNEKVFDAKGYLVNKTTEFIRFHLYNIN